MRTEATPIDAPIWTVAPATSNGSARDFQDTAAKAVGGIRQPAVEHNDGELVAANARHQLAAGDRRGEPLGKLADQLVARGMTVDIVHPLEAVEIDDEGAAALATRRRIGKCAVEALAQKDAIGEAAQHIVVGQVAAVLLRLAERRDVGDDRDQQRQAAGVDQPLAGDDRPHLSARVGDHLLVFIFLARGEDEVVLCPKDVGLFVRQEVMVRLANEFLARTSQELAQCLVHQHPSMVAILDEDRGRQDVDNHLQRLYAVDGLGGSPGMIDHGRLGLLGLLQIRRQLLSIL